MILTHASPRRVVGTDAASSTLSRRLARIRLTVAEHTRFSRNIAVRVRGASRGYNRKVKTKILKSQIQSKLNLGVQLYLLL